MGSRILITQKRREGEGRSIDGRMGSPIIRCPIAPYDDDGGGGSGALSFCLS